MSVINYYNIVNLKSRKYFLIYQKILNNDTQNITIIAGLKKELEIQFPFQIFSPLETDRLLRVEKSLSFRETRTHLAFGLDACT